MDDDNFDDEVNNLIEWCEDLDYDKYIEGWHSIATSGKPQVPVEDNGIQVFNSGLGDLTIGLASGIDPALQTSSVSGANATGSVIGGG